MAHEPACPTLIGRDVSIVNSPVHPKTGQPEVLRIVDAWWHQGGTVRLLVVSCADDRLHIASAGEVVLLVEDPARPCLVPHRRRA